MSSQIAMMNWIHHPDRTAKELDEARKTASLELRDEIEDCLDRRFPGWGPGTHIKSDSAKPNIEVHFMKERKTFQKAKDAYVWLVDHMVSDDLDMSGIVVTKMFTSGVNGGCFAAKTLEELFHGDSKKISNRNIWHELPNGWFLSLILSNKQKLERLYGLSAVVGLKHEDWSWQVEGELDDDLSTLDELLGLGGVHDPR
jgi:hypothetical protein